MLTLIRLFWHAILSLSLWYIWLYMRYQSLWPNHPLVTCHSDRILYNQILYERMLWRTSVILTSVWPLFHIWHIGFEDIPWHKTFFIIHTNQHILTTFYFIIWRKLVILIPIWPLSLIWHFILSLWHTYIVHAACLQNVHPFKHKFNKI